MFLTLCRSSGSSQFLVAPFDIRYVCVLVLDFSSVHFSCNWKYRSSEIVAPFSSRYVCILMFDFHQAIHTQLEIQKIEERHGTLHRCTFPCLLRLWSCVRFLIRPSVLTQLEYRKSANRTAQRCTVPCLLHL